MKRLDLAKDLITYEESLKDLYISNIEKYLANLCYRLEDRVSYFKSNTEENLIISARTMVALIVQAFNKRIHSYARSEARSDCENIFSRLVSDIVDDQIDDDTVMVALNSDENNQENVNRRNSKSRDLALKMFKSIFGNSVLGGSPESDKIIDSMLN